MVEEAFSKPLNQDLKKHYAGSSPA